jgi:hypothetical protein
MHGVDSTLGTSTLKTVARVPFRKSFVSLIE